jgi:hypothetical protein
MSSSHVVANFLPSTSGLHFQNNFPSGPTVKLGPLDPRWVGIGDAKSGLCGGMSWYTRERYVDKKPIPPDTVPPANGSELFQAIVRRQVLSLDWLKVPLRFYALSAWNRPKAGNRAVDRDWSKITGFLDKDQMRIVGLIRQQSWNPFGLTQNHQVLAYGYSDDGATRRLRIYDPNHPNNDTIELVITDAGLSQTTGEKLLDLFDAG